MNNEKKKIKIKVIKKNEIGNGKKPKTKEITNELRTRRTAATISGWVNDAKALRYSKAKAAVENFNRAPIQTT